MVKNKSTIKKPKINFTLNSAQRFILGSSLMIFGAFLGIALISFLSTAENDQSILSEFNNRSEIAENIMSKSGAWLGDFFVRKGFGYSSIIFAWLTLLSGFYVLMSKSTKSLAKNWFWGCYVITNLSVLTGLVFKSIPMAGGTIGFEITDFLAIYIGNPGIIMVLILSTVIYMAMRWKISTAHFSSLFTKFKKTSKQIITTDETPTSSFIKPLQNLEPTINSASEIELIQPNKKTATSTTATEDSTKESELQMEVKVSEEEASEADNLASKLVSDFGPFDPKLELSNFKFPPLNLLQQYDSESITINQEELEDNKTKIVDTLSNYNIGIANIKATIGPTVTLYEIVPDAGIRISKIKNLEDDIALSLSALGIRIIAPIPGKGTIGIEVPNKNATTVSMHSVISSKKFQKSEMQLPIALGKTISNETLVVDLAKMPHLLMAGATGQGKSVGLNAVLTSLLYKKHPAEVKFVLVDPKKVELTLFNKIERHYLAKLPDSEEAIITDNKKVINTLNSLCIEMDNRYELLKSAFCRNIAEYNKKFIKRKLNPNDGHSFLPYIVLVVDEFADLIMTAGKEVETPIARLAQLARAIGIHLIIATQRPSVNVITGLIKANFPARVAFRVTSKIDSRTILDGSGADQLIGRGDMLFTQGNDMIRLQCAFVDTPEVERLTGFIGAQKAYPEAHLLPEYVGEESGTTLDNNINERDVLFREAAEVIVMAQQGSASLLQRKLKLGYNRAGRIIDQLEAAGIVGPFEGSKARQVIPKDLAALDDHLNQENKL